MHYATAYCLGNARLCAYFRVWRILLVVLESCGATISPLSDTLTDEEIASFKSRILPAPKSASLASYDQETIRVAGGGRA